MIESLFDSIAPLSADETSKMHEEKLSDMRPREAQAYRAKLKKMEEKVKKNKSRAGIEYEPTFFRSAHS